MFLLIHVAVPLANEDAVQSEVGRCCAETGDIPLGRRVYKESGEVLLVVRLVQDYHLSEHVKLLNQALQQQIILSFQSEVTNLVSVRCKPPRSIVESMHDFPLQWNESWFPAIADPHQAYFCTRRMLIGEDQIAWFNRHHFSYQYI